MIGVIVRPFWVRWACGPTISISSPDEPELARLRNGQLPDNEAASNGADDASDDCDEYSRSPDSVLETDPNGDFATSSIRASSHDDAGLFDGCSSSIDHIC